jgi:6-phosphogluconolactonase
MKRELVVRGAIDDQIRSAARFVVARLNEAIAAHKAASIALAGGSTPKALYERLALEHKTDLDWTRVHVFFGDERCVPFTSSDSNYKMARESFILPLAVPVSHVHPMPAMQPDYARACAEYEKELRQVAHGETSVDLALLGLGEDGHTASLFPGEKAVDERVHWVAHVETKAKPPPHRLTLTLPAFECATSVAFLVNGAGKSDAVRRVLEPATPADHALPSGRIRARERVVWFLDRAAAGELAAPH